MNTSTDSKVEDISKRILDAILEENILDKEKVLNKIKSLILIWVNIKSTPKKKNTSKSRLEKILLNHHKTRIEKIYWHRKFREVVKGDMQVYYDELKEIVEQSINK